MRWYILPIVVVALGAGGGASSDDAVKNDDAVKKELQHFQGFWKAVSVQHADGTRASEDEVRVTRLTVEGNKFTLMTKNVKIYGTFSINPGTTPKAIDVVLTSPEGPETRLLGIYQIQGDTRKSCFALPESDRPRQFMSQEGYLGFEWRRK